MYSIFVLFKRYMHFWEESSNHEVAVEIPFSYLYQDVNADVSRKAEHLHFYFQVLQLLVYNAILLVYNAPAKPCEWTRLKPYPFHA